MKPSLWAWTGLLEQHAALKGPLAAFTLSLSVEHHFQFTPALNLRSHLCKDSCSYTSTPQISQPPGWVPTAAWEAQCWLGIQSVDFILETVTTLSQAVPSSDFRWDYASSPLLVKTASLPALFCNLFVNYG